MTLKRNNLLRRNALFALFITSYLPLFVILIAKQIKDNWDFLHWGGWDKESLLCFVSHFGMSCFLIILSGIGIIGVIILFRNLSKNFHNGVNVNVIKINNRNSESIGYIATYIVPFMASDFSSLFECFILIILLVIIYTIYTNSNLLLINPVLNMKYSLLDIKYCIIGGKEAEEYDALIITKTNDFKEKVDYKIYPIGFKLYYGEERES